MSQKTTHLTTEDLGIFISFLEEAKLRHANHIAEEEKEGEVIYPLNQFLVQVFSEYTYKPKVDDNLEHWKNVASSQQTEIEKYRREAGVSNRIAKNMEEKVSDFKKGSEALHKANQSLTQEVKDLETRRDELEQEIQSLPDKDNFDKLVAERAQLLKDKESLEQGLRLNKFIQNNPYNLVQDSQLTEKPFIWYRISLEEDKPLTLAIVRKGNGEERPTEFQLGLAALQDEIFSFLSEKNKRYGDSALNPSQIFSSCPPEELIKVRIDDKLARIKNNTDGDTEDPTWDLLGYLILLIMCRKNK